MLGRERELQREREALARRDGLGGRRTAARGRRPGAFHEVVAGSGGKNSPPMRSASERPSGMSSRKTSTSDAQSTQPSTWSTCGFDEACSIRAPRRPAGPGAWPLALGLALDAHRLERLLAVAAQPVHDAAHVAEVARAIGSRTRARVAARVPRLLDAIARAKSCSPCALPVASSYSTPTGPRFVWSKCSERLRSPRPYSRSTSAAASDHPARAAGARSCPPRSSGAGRSRRRSAPPHAFARRLVERVDNPAGSETPEPITRRRERAFYLPSNPHRNGTYVARCCAHNWRRHSALGPDAAESCPSPTAVDRAPTELFG